MVEADDVQTRANRTKEMANYLWENYIEYVYMYLRHESGRINLTNVV